MNPLFVAKVKYTKQLDNGSFKRVSEQFVLEAMTFGHAEERIFEQLNHINGEVVLDDLKRTSFHDMFFGFVPETEEPLFVQAKISIHALTDDSETPKAVAYKFLIRVKDFSEAEGYLNELIDSVGLDITKVETQSLAKTPFVDYFPMGEAVETEKDLEVKVKITAPDGTTVETDMDGLTNGLNNSIKNRMESLTERED